jgi:acetoin:2,6-dichlorophenolindophenol oxidoreductase subunit beta
MTAAIETRQLSYWQALNEAIKQEMRRDQTVFVMGEDQAGAAGRQAQGLIDAWGGPFGVTRGLIQEFGPERVKDTPISEAAFIGAGVGAAINGLRPVVDLMFTHFAGVAWDQITNKFAREHYVTGGQACVSMVLKTFGPCYAPFLHFPGMKCVAPSDPYTAKGLMTAAIRDDNPVVIFDSLRLLRTKGPVPEAPYTIELGKSRVVKEGSDVTLIGVSWLTTTCLDVAQRFESQGVDVEVVDLLTLEPLDEDTILRSLAKTKRIVITDQDHPRCSLARDIACIIAERAFDYLDAPIVTVTPPAIPELTGPDETRIEDAIRRVIE